MWQGSCLASTLFNIYINDIVNIDKEAINIYADDIMIEVNGKQVTDLNIKTNNLLNKINEYCKRNNMTLNLKKCKYMNIKGRKRYKEEEISINISGNSIEKVTSYKYLGIIIDNKFNWNEQMN